MNKFFALLVLILVGGSGWYWYTQMHSTNPPIQQTEKMQEENNNVENAPIITANAECYDSEKYFVILRERENGDVGSDILLKPKLDIGQTFPCEYIKAEGDIELAEPGPTYFLDITGVFLLLDHGTAPPPRGLTVYDLLQKKEVYADKYNRPIETGDNTFTYWQPIETRPTAANCPDLETWTSMGLGAGIERHVTLSLATQKITDLGEERCAARQ